MQRGGLVDHGGDRRKDMRRTLGLAEILGLDGRDDAADGGLELLDHLRPERGERGAPFRRRNRQRPRPARGAQEVERARMGGSREVPVEVIVNGYPVERRTLVADGTLREMTFEVPIERSSWVALRILPSSHTNPVWVTVGDKPVRASRRSVTWCRQGVDRAWSQKERFIAPAELAEAREAYDHARRTYDRLLTECDVD